jgi:hypothetical protein
MEVIIGDACNSCPGRALCEERAERLQELEERAERIGVLATEGNLRCVKGPRRFTRYIEGIEIPRQVCRPEISLPQLNDVELAEEAVGIWPNAPLQPVREDSLQSD